MKNRLGTFFNDNIAAVYTLVNGASKVEDAASLAWALHLRLTGLSSPVWWEWLQSKSNIADGGIREGLSCHYAKSVGCRIKEVSCPLPPWGFPRSSPETCGYGGWPIASATHCLCMNFNYLIYQIT